jgi:hypothetical protein
MPVVVQPARRADRFRDARRVFDALRSAAERPRHVGPEGQDLLVYDPIFPAYQDIQKDIIVPELAPLWDNKKTAPQVAESLVPKVNAALKAQR